MLLKNRIWTIKKAITYTDIQSVINYIAKQKLAEIITGKFN